jgi:glycerol-3-phosphate dehydrogenase (NAD(P)+)
MRETAERVRSELSPDAELLSVAKGIEQGSLMRMTQVLADVIPAAGPRIAAMSGPNLALEIARGLPASAVVATENEDVGVRASDMIGTRSFRVYRNRDVIGVELCGALKNIIAIAAGATDQLGFGDNGKAGLITRGLAEMTRLGIAAGANPLTFAGLAGLGDVIATCYSPLSRNHTLGVELARGRSWSEVETTLPGVAEGAYTVTAALELAARLEVDMPIAQEVYNALFEGKSVQRCLIDLLSREQKDELAGVEEWARRAFAARTQAAG